MSEDQNQRRSGDFVANAVSNGTWHVTIGDSWETTVGSLRPDSGGWEALRHRPIRDLSGGVYDHLSPISLGVASTVEEACQLFNTPIDPMQQAYLLEAQTGQRVCPIDGAAVILDQEPDPSGVLFVCERCAYQMHVPFSGGSTNAAGAE